jgi:hypothetical protein
MTPSLLRVKASRLLALGLVALGLLASMAGADAAVDYARDVEPIFSRHCYGCHGDEKQKSGLRLDSPTAVRRGGDSGEPLFVPGSAAESHLFKLVSGDDPEETMPPEGKNPVKAADLVVLKTWIDEGAVLPGSDDVALTSDHWSFQPVVRPSPPEPGSEWSNGAIDAFVARAMAGKGLSPSPRADRRTLIRRLYLVMHGLPPAPEEVEAFVADPSPDAWSELVDRALASPHFGERWARHWLDIVRFAETNGFETNRERLTAYHFRDYVIRSFNEDKPYDQMVREHIAGDAFGAPVGTGFLVAGPYDIVKSPDVNLTLMQRQDELADMINTTGTAFLGLTLGCARCHNHKFDPVTQRDYYAMQAVFAGVSHGERAMPKASTQEERSRLATLGVELTVLLSELETLKGRAVGGTGGKREPVNAAGNVETFAPAEVKFVRFTINRTSSSQPCIDELRVFDTEGKNVALAKHGSKPTASGTLSGYDIHKLEHINDGRDGNSHSWISNSSGGWVQIEFPEKATVGRIEWARDREGRFNDRVAVDYRIEGSPDGGNWILLASSADRQPFRGASDPNAFLADLNDADAEKARGLISQIDANRQEIAALRDGVKAWIGNFGQPGATHRLYRGDPMAKREVVAPDALEVFGSLGMELDEVEQQRRVKVAEWIASKDNPLTARVMVNRLWQFVFGVGIVDTPSDFGGNGTLPTHPELLDWLAAEFMDKGWSIKHMLELMLTSETFQQSSQPRRDAERIDAGSRYLWRFQPRRLEAEAIRDSVLVVAGTLDRSVGGPGFYLHDVDRENVVHYHPKEKTGPAEWRRMIYLFKIRQEQDAVFGAFDCPDGNQVIPKRSRSTTPLQALNLFNSPFILAQADKLAERVMDEGAWTPRAYALLYGRPPTEEELEDADRFIAVHGIAAFCRAMLNTNEFLFIF